MKAKKIFKGMTAAAVAAVLAASMVPMTAFAAVTADAKSISVNVPTEYSSKNVTGTWTAYKVATANPNGNAYDYAWVDGLDTVITDLPTITEISSTSWAANQTKNLAAKLSKAIKDTQNSSFVANLRTYSANLGVSESLEPGYYVFVVDAQMDNNGVKEGLLINPVLREVSDKNSSDLTAKFTTVTVDKSITGITNGSKDNSGNIAEGTVGSTVNYEIKTAFPTYDKDVKEIEDFIIADQPSANLTIDTSTIKIFNGTNEIPDTNYTLTTNDEDTNYGGKNDGIGFKIVFNDAYVLDNEGANIVVRFNANIANTGNIETKIPNDVQLDYGNDYSTGGGKKTLTDETDVFKTQLQVEKTTADGQTPLAGAGFEIYSADTIVVDGADKKITEITDFDTKYKKVDNLVYAIDDNNGNILNKKVGNEQTTTEGSNILTWNLPAGQYVIHESTVPSNYKQAGNRLVTITATANSTSTSYTYTKTGFDDDTTNKATIKNVEGQSLPGTGGMGTIIFTVAGAGVVLVAGIMLIVYMKKRKIEE